MTATRRIVVSIAGLFLGLSALFLTAGTATADNSVNSSINCGNPWNC